MKKIILSCSLLLALENMALAQSVGIGTTTPDASSVLELKATNKGFLPPRMTASEKSLVPSPKAGLMIYQTDGVKGLYVYNGSAWETVAGTTAGSNWALTGNSGTNSSTDFIGTKDNQPLTFRVNNVTSGGIYPVFGNVGLGMYALDSIIGGVANVAIGYNALHGNTSGSDNSAFGTAALFNNKTGQQNVAVGSGALVVNNTGSDNAALGAYSLYSNISGQRNIAIGSNALYYSQTGNSNIAIGYTALRLNETGSNNIALGIGASANNKIGNNIISIGDSALAKNTASYNMAVGIWEI